MPFFSVANDAVNPNGLLRRHDDGVGQLVVAFFLNVGDAVAIFVG